jgi:hypothetical protein
MVVVRRSVVAAPLANSARPLRLTTGIDGVVEKTTVYVKLR